MQTPRTPLLKEQGRPGMGSPHLDASKRGMTIGGRGVCVGGGCSGRTPAPLFIFFGGGGGRGGGGLGRYLAVNGPVVGKGEKQEKGVGQVDMKEEKDEDDNIKELKFFNADETQRVSDFLICWEDWGFPACFQEKGSLHECFLLLLVPRLLHPPL